jgi:hypothetical protein
MAKRLPAHEEEILRRVYPTEGSRGVHALLPHRAMGSIKVIAHKRDLKTAVGTGGLPKFDIIAALAANRWCTKLAAHVVGCSEHTVRTAMRRQHAADRAAAQARIDERRIRSAPAQTAEAA